MPEASGAEGGTVLSTDGADLTAVFISDLHFTKNENSANVYVPGMAFAETFTEAVIAEVIDMKPDVLILTGDNTNTGSEEDVAALVSHLEKVKEAGTAVLITTGNHDFYGCDAEEFEAAYFGLMELEDRDPASLSGTALIGDTVFLVMDDNSYSGGARGSFSEATVSWLGDMLARYRSQHVVYLGHHPLFAGKDTAHTGVSYLENTEVIDLLIKKGVQAAFTGHLHAQLLAEKNGLYEIVNAMPFSGRHAFGFLRIADGTLTYTVQPIDFEKYADEDFCAALAQKDAETAAALTDTIRSLLEAEGISGTELDDLAALAGRFFACVSEGSIADHAQELISDAGWHKLVDTLMPYNYGEWMRNSVQHPPLPANHLTLTLQPAGSQAS